MERAKLLVRNAEITGLLILSGISVWRGIANALQTSDSAEWQPSRMLLFGHDPAQIFLGYVNGGGMTANPFIAGYPNYPPSGLVFLWPLAILPWDTFKITWAVLNVCFAVGVVYLLWRRYLKNTGYPTLMVVIALFLIAGPTRNVIGIGQNSLFSLFFFLLALSAEDSSRVGAVVALAISWFKYTLTFPLSLIFLTKRRFGLVLGAVSIHVGLTLALALWTGSNPIEIQLNPVRAYFYQVDPLGLFRSPIGDVDLFALSNRLHLGQMGMLTALILAILVGLCGAAIVMRRQYEDELLNLSLLSLVSSVCFIHSAGYDLITLVFPFTYLVRNFTESGAKVLLQPLCIAFVIAITLPWFVDRPVELIEITFSDKPPHLVSDIIYGTLRLSIYASLAICIWHTAAKPYLRRYA